MVFRITRRWTAFALFAVATGAFACAESQNPASPTVGGGSPIPSAGGGSPIPSGGGGGTATAGCGRLTVGITDTPFEDAEAVLITFDGISVHRSGGDWEEVELAGHEAGEDERMCDLKKLEGPTDVLGSELLPAGHYTQIRLNVIKATIHFDNKSTSLTACAPSITVPGTQFTDVRVPSGEVKLNGEFRLDPGATVEMLLDFDGNQSIRQQGGGASGNGNGNGRGNGTGGSTSAPEEGRYSLHPVVRILSITPQ